MLQRLQRDSRIWRVRSGSVLVLAVLALVLASCDEPPQRAVPPGAVRDTVTATPTVAPSVDPAASGTLIERPVLERELPPAEQIFFTQGGDVWRAPVDDEPEPVTEGESVADFSASAIGDRVAILSVERDVLTGAERAQPSIRLADGGTVFELADDENAIDLEDLSPIESIALTPSGDALAMTHQNGAVSLVTLAGNVEQLLDPGEGQQPGELSWSSDGRFLTYLDPWMPNEPSALYLLMPEQGTHQLLAEPGGEGYGVTQASWVPGTSQIIYVKASGSTIPHGGDVFLFDATSGEQRLLLSSSAIAPVGGAVDLAVSPDGRTAALTGFAPGDEYPSFVGMWLLDLPGGEWEELELQPEGVVSDLWWLGDDLLLRTIDEPRTRLPGTYTGQETFSLLSYDPESGELDERYTYDDPMDGPEDGEEIWRRILNQ